MSDKTHRTVVYRLPRRLRPRLVGGMALDVDLTPNAIRLKVVDDGDLILTGLVPDRRFNYSLSNCFVLVVGSHCAEAPSILKRSTGG